MEQFKISARKYLVAGEFNKVIKYLKQYLDKDMEDIEVFEILGDAYQGLSQADKAVEFYTQALAINPAHLAISLKLSANTLRGRNYIEVLKKLHQLIKPKYYIEIGVCKGGSFQLADPKSIAIGIDPEPQLDLSELPKRHCVITKTSDDYFATEHLAETLQGKPFDLAFLDGMHLFEFALRDFIYLEKYSGANSVICIHDLYPLTAETATRERNTAFWSGDVWKLALCLQEYRPDLDFSLLPCPPTGLGVVRNLNANSSILEENYNEILEKYLKMSFDVLLENKAEKLSLVAVDYLLS